MIGSDDFLAAIERSASHLVARGEVDGTSTWDDDIVNHVEESAMAAADDKVFQFEVEVVTFQVK